MPNGGKEMGGVLQDERKTEKKKYKRKNLVKLNDDNMARVQE